MRKLQSRENGRREGEEGSKRKGGGKEGKGEGKRKDAHALSPLYTPELLPLTSLFPTTAPLLSQSPGHNHCSVHLTVSSTVTSQSINYYVFLSLCTISSGKSLFLPIVFILIGIFLNENICFMCYFQNIITTQ